MQDSQLAQGRRNAAADGQGAASFLVIGIVTAAAVVALLSQRKMGEGERKATLDLLKLGSRNMQGLMLMETIKASGGLRHAGVAFGQ